MNSNVLGDTYVIKYILNILTWYLLSLNTNDFKCLDVALHVIHSFKKKIL